MLYARALLRLSHVRIRHRRGEQLVRDTGQHDFVLDLEAGRLVREDDGAAGILQLVGDTLRRRLDVERHVCPARLEVRQDGHDRVGGGRQVDADQLLGMDAAGEQPVCEAVGALVQLAVRHLLSERGHGDALGVPLDLLFEQLVDQDVGRIVGAVERPFIEKEAALGVVEELDVLDADGAFRGHGRFEDPLEVTGDLLDEGGFMDVVVEVDVADQIVAVTKDQDVQVVLAVAEVDLLVAPLQDACGGCERRVVVDREHHVEQSRAAHVVLGAQHLHQLVEGDGAVRVRSVQHSGIAAEHLGRGVGRLEARTQRNEIADRAEPCPFVSLVRLSIEVPMTMSSCRL